MTVAELRTALKDKAKGLAAIEEKATAEGATEEDVVALEDACKEIEAIERKIKALDNAEQTRARTAVPANQEIDKAPARVEQKLTASEKVGLTVCAMAKAYMEEGARGHKAAMRYLDEAGYGSVAEEFSVQRALNSGATAAGGVLVPESMANEIIDILRPNTTFLQGGPRRVPLVGGNYKVPAAASGATAAWRGEGKAATVSEPTFKAIEMSSKFLDCLVPITNQLIRFSLPDVRAWVEMDLSREMGTKLDLAAYRGAGTAYTPLGIRNIPGVSSVAATGGTAPTAAQVDTLGQGMELVMMNANLPMTGAAWVMSPRTFLHMADMRDGNGNLIYPGLQMATPMWRSKRVFFTTQMPINLGVGTDESEILLVAFPEVYYGEGTQISFSVSTEASYTTGGSTVSAFQNDLTLIKASAEADVDMRYLEAVVVGDGVRWGA